MKLFTSGRYATVASTFALVVALGGTSYAAAQITSANIKDGTIQTRDVALGARTQVHQVHNDSGTTLAGTDKTVLSIHLAAGTFSLSSKVQAFYSGTSPFVNCSLVGPSGVLDTAYWYVPGGGGYGEVVNQAVVTTTSATNVQLNCSGSNAGVYNKKLQALRVAQGTDSLGPNVAKAPLPQHLR
jgi:hypothetical protein